MKFSSALYSIAYSLIWMFFSLHAHNNQTGETHHDSSQSYALLYGASHLDEFIPYPEDENCILFNIDPSIEFDAGYDDAYEAFDMPQPSTCNTITPCTEISHCSLCKTAAVSKACQSESCCTFLNIEVHGGVYPIVWLGTDNLPKFSRLFNTPWIVGGHIGYRWNRCGIETYLEGNYARARAKGFCFDIATQTHDCCPSIIKLDLNHTHYSLYSGYLGARYRAPYLCNRFALFSGAKLGFIRHNKVDCRPGICAPCSPCKTRVPLFLKNTVVSGGALLGMNICITSCLQLLITAELVASMGLNNNACISIDPCFCPLDRRLSIGDIRSELAFPVTVGLQFEF